MKRSLSLFIILSGLLFATASAQVAIKYQGSTGNRTEPTAYKVPTGFSDTYNAGSTLTVNGILSGTPTAGTLNLSSVTLTLPGTFLTAAQVAAAYQPLHDNLTAIAGLTGAADRLFYFDGTTTVAITTFTAVARQLLDDATSADMRTTLGLGSGDTPTFAALNTAAFDGSTAQITEGSFKVSSTDGYTQQIAGSLILYQAIPEKTTEITANGIYVDGSPVATIGASTFSITGNAATVTTNANLTGHITSVGNAASLGSFTVAQLNTAISDADVATGGGTATGTNTGDQTNITGNAATVTTNANLTGHVTSVGNAAVLGSFTVAQLNTAISDADVATGGGTATGTNTGDQTITLTGDVTGTGTGSFAATIQANSVALGTDTTGNYVATIADSGASEITVANSGTENAGVTLAIASSIARDSEVSSAISALSSVYQPLEASLTALAGGSDFVVFAGPTTSTKTFTLPNSSATILYSGGPLGTPLSGVATNLTGTASGLTAGSVAVVDSTDSTSFILVVDSATGNLVAKTDSGITYNSTSGALVLTGPITAGSGSELKNTWIKSGNSTGIKLGADDGNTTLTDAVMKAANVSMPHYSSSTEEDVTVFRLTSTSGNNTLSIGGANANLNALTGIRFYTAGNNATLSGTDRGGFNSAGVFDVTTTTSSVNTTSGSGVFGGGLGVGENINAGGYIKAGGAITAATSYTLGVGGNPLKLWWGADTSNLDSVFLGYNNGVSLTSTGRYNTGIGISALSGVTSGDDNTAIGYEAGTSITTTGDSTLIGYRSGYQATGAGNTFVGSQSFMAATTGASNTGIGAAAMASLSSGGTNTALGYLAGASYSTQSGGVFLGYAAGQYSTAGNEFIVNNQDRTDAAGDQTKSLLYGTFNATAASQTLVANAQLSSSVSLGYSAGAGGTVTQDTNRTTGVTLDKVCGEITLVSAAGSTSWQSFTVTNSTVAATDRIILNQKSGTDLYLLHVTALGAGSFRITFATTGGTTTEQPVIGFTVIKGVTS